MCENCRVAHRNRYNSIEILNIGNTYRQDWAHRYNAPVVDFDEAASLKFLREPLCNLRALALLRMLEEHCIVPDPARFVGTSVRRVPLKVKLDDAVIQHCLCVRAVARAELSELR